MSLCSKIRTSPRPPQKLKMKRAGMPLLQKDAEPWTWTYRKDPERKRTDGSLHYYDELTLKEIGKVLSLTESMGRTDITPAFPLTFIDI